MLLKNKKGLIIGLSNNISIGWGIAKKCHENGAALYTTYNREAKKKRAEPLANSIDAKLIKCNAQNSDEIDNLFKTIEKEVDSLDFLVHSIAFANDSALKNDYSITSKNDFIEAMEISAYSFINFVHGVAPLMKNGGSILTVSYYGAEKVVPNYKIMGTCKAALESMVRELAAELGKYNIRVNAISSGPIKTLAASGIGGFNYMLEYNELNAPMRKNVTPEDNGKTALYLLSDLSNGVTGEIIHVDGGYHIIGMKDPTVKNVEIPEGYKF